MIVKKSDTRRAKCFRGTERWTPLDRNAKARIMTYARALTHPTEPGKHWGPLTPKFTLVLEALLWGFHNAASGKCFPSYDTLADRANVARSTVYEAIHALEACGILTWTNCIVRVREACQDLFGRHGTRWRVVRTSNAYTLIDPKPDPKPSKSELQTGTPVQDSFPLLKPSDSRLARALLRLKALAAPPKGA